MVYDIKKAISTGEIEEEFLVGPREMELYAIRQFYRLEIDVTDTRAYRDIAAILHDLGDEINRLTRIEHPTPRHAALEVAFLIRQAHLQLRHTTKSGRRAKCLV